MSEETNTAQEKPVVRISNLDAMLPAEFTAVLETEDQRFEVPMRGVSFAEYQAIGWSVPDPTPPITSAGKNGPIFDYNDAGYKRAMQQAETKRMHLRLLAALALPVPGDTDDEKIAFLQSLDANYVRMLTVALVQMVTDGKASLEAKSATFQRGRGKGR